VRAGRWRAQERKQFFFVKKNQKTFVYKAFGVAQRIAIFAKVFAYFFKKKRLLSCA
jgi:hypothetical protein